MGVTSTPAAAIIYRSDAYDRRLIMRAMDFREAKACLDEYRIAIAATCGMMRLNVAGGELDKAIGDLNDSLITALKSLVKEARVLSITIWEELIKRKDQMLDFPDEWAGLLIALDEIQRGTNEAAEKLAHHVQATRDSDAKRTGPKPSASALAIQKFRRERGMMNKQEREE
jgi:hypothetical protein